MLGTSRLHEEENLLHLEQVQEQGMQEGLQESELAVENLSLEAKKLTQKIHIKDKLIQSLRQQIKEKTDALRLQRNRNDDLAQLSRFENKKSELLRLEEKVLKLRNLVSGI